MGFYGGNTRYIYTIRWLTLLRKTFNPSNFNTPWNK
jgi:hypothetical protein